MGFDAAARDAASQAIRTDGAYIYNAGIGLRKTKAELAKLKAGATRIVNFSVIGDSISEGGNAGAGPSDYQTKGYVGRLRTALATKFGDVGMGFIPPLYPFSAPYWVSSGWVSSSIGFGVNGEALTSSTNGHTLTWTFTGTGLSLFFGGNGTTGTVTVTIDGGAPVAFDTFKSGGVVDGKLEYSIDGLSVGSHTVVITKTNDTKPVYFLGSYAHTGSTGVRVHNVSRWGMKAINGQADLQLQLEIDQWQPTLTILSYLANDVAQGTTLADYTTYMQKIITRAQTYGDVLLLSLGTNSSINGATVKQYADIQLQLALKNNCAFIDVFNLWGASGTYASTTLGLLADNVHPNDYGHQHIVSEILNLIMGGRY